LEHDPPDRVLRAYPKKAFQGDYQQVLMVVSPQFDIRRLRVIFPDQSSMEFSFDHIGRNAPVSRSLFRFTPPPGTEVIDQH
jgi:outer membrane lipoprotein-sorting protein